MNESAARYADGKTSRVRDVEVKLFKQGLIIYDDADTPLAKWPYAGTKVAEDWITGIGAIFARTKDNGEQLTITNQKLFSRIKSNLDYKHQATFIVPVNIASLMALTVAAVIAVLVFFPLFGKASGVVAYLVPRAAEEKLAELTLTEIEKQFPACEDPVAKQLLDKIVTRLVKNGSKPLEPDIHFYRTPMVNALTLPGEKMAVFSGFLQRARNENEVAGVLAHELGHMVYRDPLEGFVQAQGMSVVGGMIAGGGSSFGSIGQAAAVLQTLSFSREKELRADKYAAETLRKAGYKTSPLADFLVAMYASTPEGLQKREKTLSLLSTHPVTSERVQALGGTSAKNYTFKPSLTKAEFVRLQQACRKNKEKPKP